MNILYLPLDERPCNYIYPQMIASSCSSLHLTIPSLNKLSQKRVPASFITIQDELMSQVLHQDALIISLDMLLYGGLIPSRLHHLHENELKERLYVLKQLKEVNPSLKIYAFECIMRCPHYNSSEEEPEYYEQYGYALFQRKYLEDKKQRSGLSVEEEKRYQSLDSIPLDIINDFETRRHINRHMNELTLQYLKEGFVDFLVIPQDDSSPYGYTAIDQKKILNEIKVEKLYQKVMVYPGADEVGLSLMTRAYNDYYHKHPSIYPFFASTLGPSIVPLYEDRPMLESLKSHVLVTGAYICDSKEEADIILAVNCPGKVMQESFDENKDVTYSTYRQLKHFALKIKEYLDSKKTVALADCAFANGGDEELIEYLDDMHLLDQLKAYAGWNTSCNTIGTVLSQAQLGEDAVANNIYHIIEDVFYQASVRSDIVNHDLKELGLSYYDFKNQESVVEQRIASQLLKRYSTLQLSQKYPIHSIDVYLPWHRMFEIGMKFK